MTRELVYPVKVSGTSIAHLATAVFDEAGGGYRAICPAGPLITAPLQLIAVGEPIVWCGACRAWADAARITLPAVDPTGGGSGGTPAVG